MIHQNPQILSDKRLVGIICKPGRMEIERVADRIAQLLISRDINVQIDQGSCNVTHDKVVPTPIEEMDVDFVITIGGDGTILYTLSKLKDRSTPIFCINRGTVGFLTETGTKGP